MWEKSLFFMDEYLALWLVTTQAHRHICTWCAPFSHLHRIVMCLLETSYVSWE